MKLPLTILRLKEVMQMKPIALFGMAVLAVAGICSIPATEAYAQLKRPNIVFFLVDDLGWADVGCYGSTFYETPNIDALAASGVKFSAGYAACPVCSPTRASILTGRHPVRLDITDWIPGYVAGHDDHPRFAHINDRDELSLDEITIAEALKEYRYQTFFAGKWHLGDKGFLPQDQGFDFNLGGHHKGSPPGGYYSPFRNPQLADREEGEYLTERLTDESVSFLASRNPDQPFLLYLSYYNVHTPIQPYKKRYDHYLEKANRNFPATVDSICERNGFSRSRQDNPKYASMVAAIDDSLGKILQRLEELKLSDNTVVVFFSDNGGLCTSRKTGPTCNLPLRSGKGWLYEGGIRVPMIVKAPGVASAGTTCDLPVSSVDFFPTLLDLAKVPTQKNHIVDGESLTPLLSGEEMPSRPLYWHYPHYHGSTWRPGAAIRDGDWKLIEFYEHDEVELYNLKDDIGERQNLAGAEPQRTEALRVKLSTWQKEIKAKMPISQRP